MAWTPQLLAEAVQTLPELNIDIEYNEQSLIIKMNDYGDLSAVLIRKVNSIFSYYVIRNSFLCLPWGFLAFSRMNITSHLEHFRLIHHLMM